MEEKAKTLHPAQRDIYVDQMININSPLYNIGGYLRLEGNFNKEKFHEALSSAYREFDAFKMRFDLNASDSLFFIDEEFDGVELNEMDFTAGSDPEEEAMGWMQNRFNTPFIFNKENLLFEHSLLKVSGNEHIFFGKYHHLITDGYGFIVFVEYLSQKYKSLIENEELTISHHSYIEEAEKASEYFQSPAYQTDKAYWDSKIAIKPEKILNKKYFRKNSGGKKGSSIVINIPEEQKNILGELQALTKSGLQQLTIAALLIYFGKTTDKTEFVFGIPLHKRTSRKLRNMVGMFSGVLPFKGIFDKEKTLAQHISEIMAVQKNDYRHQNYPVGDISRNLKLNPSDGYLHEVTINYELLNFELDFGNDIKASIERLANEYDTNPLQLCWKEYGQDKPLRLQIQFLKEYFSKEEAEFLGQRILYILQQFKNSLEKECKDIEIIPDKERSLLEQFNYTDVKYPFEKSIIDFFEEQVSKSPDKAAVIFEDRQLSYKELNERSNQFARYLLRKGIKKETLVPVCMDRSFEMIISILGILKSGAAFVPLDPSFPEDRILYMLKDSGSKFIIVNDKSKEELKNPDEELAIINFDRDREKIQSETHENINNDIKGNQLIYVIYTSGSTGTPKGVMIEHSNVMNLLLSIKEKINFTQDSSFLSVTTFSFDICYLEFFTPLISGGNLILLPKEISSDGFKLSESISQYHPTHIQATPSAWNMLSEAGWKNNDGVKILCGGESLSENLKDELVSKGEAWNLYGPTETTIWSTAKKLEQDEKVLIGTPVSNTKIYIVNKDEQLNPIGIEGEIYIGGEGVARGYLNRDELTKEKFIENIFDRNCGREIYKTGDIGRWLPDGNIEHLGRSDEQVKVRGFRIELGEIESVMMQSDLIEHAVVVAKEDKSGGKVLSAYIIAKNKFDKEEVVNFLRKKLPDYMIPSLWMQMEKFPLTPNGKIDKKALPVPDADETIRRDYEAPQNEIEIKIAGMWKEILNISKAGINDNFFELGGHSLNAIQLVSRIHKNLNIKIDTSVIFKNPTIKELCNVLHSEKQSKFDEIKKLPDQKYYQLSHSQKRYWILSHFKEGSEAYNVTNVFTITGNLKLPEFKNAFDTIIERHEILRTVFEEINGEPMQKILTPEEAGFKISETDLRKVAGKETVIKNYADEEKNFKFDLSKGPLIKAALFREEEEKFSFVFTIHHIIGDAWSKEIFTREVFEMYNINCTGNESSLPPLNIQYKDYAAWHNASYETQNKFWKELYKEEIPVLNFPADFERPKVLTFFGEMLHSKIPEELTSGLKRIAARNNMSLNNLLVSLYAMTAARFSNQEEVVIGTISSGRSHIDLENLIGVFINFLPLKLSPKKHLRLSEYLLNSNADLIKAYSNQDYPFDKMVDECIKHRDISRNPFFDTMVNCHPEGEKINSYLSGTEITAEENKTLQENLFQSVLDFKLDIITENKTLDFYLSYNTKLFSEERMKNFLAEYIRLLENAVKDSNKYLTEYGDWEEKNQQIEIPKNENMQKELPVVICSSFVSEPVKEYMEYWSNEIELNIGILFAPYNQIFQQLLNPDSLFNSNTGLNFLLLRTSDWLRDNKTLQGTEQINFLEKTYNELIEALEISNKVCNIPCVVAVFPVYPSQSFPKEISEHLERQNKNLESFLKGHHRFYLIDLEKIISLYDVADVYDSKSDEIAHMPFTQEYYAALGTYMARRVNAFKNLPYKVIALDCDNTLWEGICGEEGAEGVRIDKNFIQLQEFMIEKYKEGFLIVLCSKNNEDDVWEVFEKNPGMKLKREHISAYGINWESKNKNLREIAKELNLGLNSIIFLDDNEFETEQMLSECPEVLSLTLPEDRNNFLSFLNHIWSFDNFKVTEEDLKRNQMYKEEKLRKEEQVKHGTVEEFLESLKIEVHIKQIEEKEVERTVQLCMRTNQFNLNGIRKTTDEILRSMKDERAINWIIEVRDRFGDYGATGVVIGKQKQNILELETFLLSCRVLGRKVEDTVLKELKNYCLLHGLKEIKPLHEVTQKNKPFLEFFNKSEWKVKQQKELAVT